MRSAQRRPSRSSAAIIGRPVREPRTGRPGRGTGMPTPPPLRFQKPHHGATDFEPPGGDRMPGPRLQPRIAPLEPPYAPEIDAGLRAMMPRNSPVEPLRLFRTFVRHPPLAEAMTALGRFVLGRELTLDLHDRELVIDRVCARCGCEYEWGVHAVFFGARAGFTAEQLDATVTGGDGATVWNERESLLVRLVDELHDTARVSDALWDALARHW